MGETVDEWSPPRIHDEEKSTPSEYSVAVSEPPRKVHGVAWFLLVLAIYSSTFLYALDNTIVANIQPAIVHALDGVDKIAWVGVAFLMASSATLLTILQLFSQFNIKWMYIISIAIFEIGSAVCGAAPTMNAMIGGRIICGVGGVGQYIGVMNFMPRLTTMKERPIYIGAIGITWGAGTVLGPILGGAFTDSSAGWRWSFYINLCIGGLFAPVYLFLLPSLDPQPRGTPLKQRFARIDFLGSFLLIGAFVAGIIGVNFAGVEYAWSAPGIIVALVLSGVAFIAFGFQQVYCILTTPETRLFPVEMVSWRQPLMVMVFVCGCCATVCLTVPTYMIPLHFQFVSADGSLQAAVRLLPFVCLLVFSSVAGGYMVSVLPYYKPWFLVGGALCLIGSALMFTVRAGTSAGAIYGYSAILGLGSGMYSQLGHSVAQAKTPVHQLPAAVAFTTTAQLNGMTFALSLAQCVFLNEAIKHIQWVLPNESHERIVSTISGAGSTLVQSLDPETQGKVIDAIVYGLDRAYILSIVAGALVVLMGLAMKWEKLELSGAVAG
ncbi:putative MFS transporter [Aspergillus alliaceus]|uniref:putative MFS transporter n=1 Tax=Petromyces alliaceus TaxID=209559 RepID=UPI0012A4DCB3|nr:major facilitator superfamily domain-containing protein [Aspergillus alliaceus]KAB8236171.1 major facilitator superfamily domain-containing protein [Aspergillus alliaceus]